MEHARDGSIKIRIKPDEKAEWQAMAKAEKLTLTDLIRRQMRHADLAASMVNRKPKETRTGRKADPALIQCVGRVGSNLNQIARWANSFKSAAEASEILLALVAIENMLMSDLSIKRIEANRAD
jgi:hypothetical protein